MYRNSTDPGTVHIMWRKSFHIDDLLHQKSQGSLKVVQKWTLVSSGRIRSNHQMIFDINILIYLKQASACGRRPGHGPGEAKSKCNVRNPWHSEGGGRKGRGRTWKRKNSGQSKALALVSKGGSSDASVQATLCQPVHGTSFELNSLASMFYLFLSCPPPHCVMGFLHYRVCLGVVTFFAELSVPARTFHNEALWSYEPEPSRSLQLKEK